MKNKIFTLVEIAIVLCSMFLVALSGTGLATGQEMQEVHTSEVTTTSEDDYVLGVYGNANEDDMIDMRDLTYVKLIFFGKKTETELADAKYDGKVNPLDFIQIKLIIVGKEKELTIVDSADRIVTVKKPVEKIVTLTVASTESSKILKAQDKVVGVVEYIKDDEVLFPELSELPSVGTWYTGVDYEKMFELDPDIVITYVGYTPDLEEMLEPAGITVVRLDLYKPVIMINEIKKLGYILDTDDEAEEFIDFYEKCLNSIKEKAEDIPEEDKPRVYHEFYTDYAGWSSGGWDIMIATAGGINIIAELPGGYGGYVEDIDPEWVVKQNPDIIVRDVYYAPNGYEVDDPSGMEAEREAVLTRLELAGITDIRSKDVYAVSFHIVDTIRHFVGTAYMAKWFHPKLFEDLDPNAIHQEYLTRFMQLDYDLDEHGVFVYHPEQHPDGR